MMPLCDKESSLKNQLVWKHTVTDVASSSTPGRRVDKNGRPSQNFFPGFAHQKGASLRHRDTAPMSTNGHAFGKS